MAYSYLKRKIQTCQARQTALASQTIQNLSNIYEQAQRPILVHSGPTPHREYGKAQTDPGVEWPWIHCDQLGGTERNYTLDKASVWPMANKMRLDISLRLMGVSALFEKPSRDSRDIVSVIPITFVIAVSRFVNGTDVRVAMPEIEIEKQINFYGINEYQPLYPAHAAQVYSMNYRDIMSFDKNLSVISGTVRTNRLYQDDIHLLNSLFASVEIDMATWGDILTDRTYPLIVEVKAYCDLNGTPFSTSLADEYQPGQPSNTYASGEYFRLYNVGSEMRLSGVIT